MQKIKEKIGGKYILLTSVNAIYDKWKMNKRKKSKAKALRKAQRDFLMKPVKKHQKIDDYLYKSVLQWMYGCKRSDIPEAVCSPIEYYYLDNGKEEKVSFNLGEEWNRAYRYFEIVTKTRESCRQGIRRIEHLLIHAQRKRRNLFIQPYLEGKFDDIFTILETQQQNVKIMEMFPRTFELLKTIETIMLLTRLGTILKSFFCIPDRELYLTLRFALKNKEVPKILMYIDQFSDSSRVKAKLYNFILTFQASIPEELKALFKYNEEYPWQDTRLIIFMSKGYTILDNIKNALKEHLVHKDYCTLGDV